MVERARREAVSTTLDVVRRRRVLVVVVPLSLALVDVLCVHSCGIERKRGEG